MRLLTLISSLNEITKSQIWLSLFYIFTHAGKRSRLSIGTTADNLENVIELGVARSKLRLMASNTPINMKTVIRTTLHSRVINS